MLVMVSDRIYQKNSKIGSLGYVPQIKEKRKLKIFQTASLFSRVKNETLLVCTLENGLAV